MTLTARQRRTLDTIEQHLGAREPRLASMFAMFTKLTKDELPPTLETIELRRWNWLAEPIARSRRRYQRRRRARANNGALARFVNVAFVPFLVLGLLVTVIVVAGHGSSANRCSQLAGYHSAGVAKLTTPKCASWSSQPSRWHPQ
ncbi:MAG TPA: hypothetical protein VEV63_00700 [Streptosporangiaceae bacterium]|nr:hypothetical protein [Streptosporangiaceae bacterium]